ncbi:DUF1516 family protein [Nicoliella lavandulae]|uniref:DUF1516 family protein n=1 Tax=Nicoliella lavandulae TaxID=3082954 RepID=A0ABU8SJE1_9LACO
MLLWLHLIFVLILIISASMGLLLRSGNQFYIMIVRVCYLVFIVSGILLFSHAWARDPFLTIVKIIVAIGLIGILEVSFAKRKRNQLTKQWIVIDVLAFIVVIIVGLLLAGGRPFIR